MSTIKQHVASGAVVLTFAFVAASSVATAAVIDFETIPGVGTPTEGLAISNQFLASEGVSFSLEEGGSPIIAQVGSPVTAFFSPLGDDTPATGQGIGSFFLTDDGTVERGPVGPLLIDYAVPTMAASGVFLDIDGNPANGNEETYIIEARDSSDNVLETTTIVGGDPGTGDALATPWSFDRPTADIFSIRISGDAVGIGFDRFNATQAAIPEPGTFALLLIGLCGLVARRRRTG